MMDLLPCPFCNGEPIIEYWCRNGIKIKCKSCCVQFRQKVLTKTVDWLKEVMVEDWNRRVRNGE